VVRYEHGILVRVEEAGEAREVGEELIASPIEPRGASPLPADAVLTFVQRVEGNIERIVVSEGVAEHEYGERRWRETTRRVHLSLTDGPYRALLDFADFDTDVGPVLDALAGLKPGLHVGRASARPTLHRVRLAPNVTAALLPLLIGSIEMEQMPAENDGYGQPIERCPVEREPPNWYRPSYRIRPVRLWHNLRAVPFGSLEDDVPRAIALLAPPERGLLQVLCVAGEEAFAASVKVASVRAVGEAGRWYPYAAGAFGAEMLL
jgi:hypothetical protein